MGPVLFATAIQELLTKLQNDHPCVVVLAYLDDVFLVGPSDNVLAVFEDLKPMFHNIGLDIQDTKCESYNPSSVEMESHTSIPITTEGISILGIPVGKEDFMSQACVTIAKHGENLCHQLLTLGTQEAMLLLRFCHLPRMFYLSQSVKPKSMQAAAVLHDHLSCSTFSNLLQISALTDKKWKQATLPIRYGGFGLTSLQEISTSFLCPRGLILCMSCQNVL